MRRAILAACAACLFVGAALAEGPEVKTGIDVLRSRRFDILQGKRVGLVTNPTGLARDLESTIDILYTAPGVTLVALYGPEHGVRGDAGAGAYVESYTDSRTGLPVYSLYGKTRKPTKEMLKDVDVLVYDIQDTGVRPYTFISTMGLVMEAAAENNIPFVVLDRPDPLTGSRVEGPMLNPAFKSFIGAFPIPYMYGLTPGELAKMINGEHWLTGGAQCSLTIVPMEGWNRSMWWGQTGLMWVPTSPHIPHWESTIYNVLTGLIGEIATANQGVGYTLPFELVGAPWMDQFTLSRYLNGLDLKGLAFRPITYRPYYHDSTNVEYKGVQIHVTNPDSIDFARAQLSIIEALIHLYPENDLFAKAKPANVTAFDRAFGSSDLRDVMAQRQPIDGLLAKIKSDCEKFKVQRKPYLIYE